MRWVALDTSIVIAEGFNFEGANFSALREAAENGAICIIIVDMVDREVRRNIQKHIGAAVSSIRNTRLLDATGLHDFKAARDAVAGGAAERAVEQRWDEFLATHNVVRLSIDDVKPSLVMDAYLGQRPPFSAKKPKEFPDAFVIERLRKLAADNQTEVHVLSTDPDYAAASDGKVLVVHDRIAEYISKLLVSLEDYVDEQLLDAVELFLEGESEEIKRLVADHLMGLSVSIEEDWQAEASEIRVNKIDVYEHDIVSVQAGQVQIEVLAAAKVEVDSHVQDHSTARYDEGDLVYIESHDVTIKHDFDARFTLALELDDERFPMEVTDVSLVEPTKLDLELSGSEVVYHPEPPDYYDDGYEHEPKKE